MNGKDNIHEVDKMDDEKAYDMKFNHRNGVEKMIKNYARDKLLFMNGKVTILRMVSSTWLVTFM
jgi:hypothetical protein